MAQVAWVEASTWSWRWSSVGFSTSPTVCGATVNVSPPPWTSSVTSVLVLPIAIVSRGYTCTVYASGVPAATWRFAKLPG